MPQINDLKLNHSFTSQLPADLVEVNSARQVLEACYSFVDPKKPKNPSSIHVNDEVAKILEILDTTSPLFLDLMTGAANFKGFRPYAMCYGGHQFGHWAGQLGDGRAINIAEVETEKHGKWVLQLKGAGRTPYSRGADGLAVLRSSIREYLMSEAMFYLGVPTTRALALSLTGDEVLRDVLYNGNAAYEKGAIVCRVAPTFIRFGNFEIFAARADHKNLKKLVDFTITQYYPEIGLGTKENYLAFFKAVADRSLEMVIHWQRVGFVHGVMNTDNMSVLGLTIDYGPYGWLENYDPAWTPNTTDAQHKRYRFGNQPQIVLWNLMQFANAIYPLIDDVPALEAILDDFNQRYQSGYLRMMFSKLGLFKTSQDNRDAAFINSLTENLRKTSVDMTLFFRNLTSFDVSDPLKHIGFIRADSYLQPNQFNSHSALWEIWLNQYATRLKRENHDTPDRMVKMNAVNPKYVLRNYMAHLAIQSADKGDYSVLNELFHLLKNPYSDQPDMDRWFAKRPSWADEKVGCSMLSCSS